MVRAGTGLIVNVTGVDKINDASDPAGRVISDLAGDPGQNPSGTTPYPHPDQSPGRLSQEGTQTNPHNPASGDQADVSKGVGFPGLDERFSGKRISPLIRQYQSSQMQFQRPAP